MTDATVSRLTQARQALLPFGVAMTVASVFAQVAIAASGQQIGLLAVLLTGMIAVAYVTFLVRYGRDLGKVRFGLLAAHAVVYAAVNAGFGLHFFLLAVTDSAAVRGPQGSAEGFVMDPGWFGAAVAMPAWWGVGLLVHALGALAGRGFEAAR